MSVLAIVASARGDSQTAQLLDLASAGRSAVRIDLRDLDIQQYEYEWPMDRDDFRLVAEAMIAHTSILLATPVYWYSMSGRLKVLFDRLSDLTTVRKDIGQQLKGRRLFVLACGAGPQLPDGFAVPFSATAAYLGMGYGGIFYAQVGRRGVSAEAAAAAARFGDEVWALDGDHVSTSAVDQSPTL